MLCLVLDMQWTQCNDKLLWGSVYLPLLVECGEVNLLLTVCRRPNVSLGLCQELCGLARCPVLCCRILVLYLELDMLSNGDPHVKQLWYRFPFPHCRNLADCICMLYGQLYHMLYFHLTQRLYLCECQMVISYQVSNVKRLPWH